MAASAPGYFASAANPPALLASAENSFGSDASFAKPAEFSAIALSADACAAPPSEAAERADACWSMSRNADGFFASAAKALGLAARAAIAAGFDARAANPGSPAS